jgi:hypothetical protein
MDAIPFPSAATFPLELSWREPLSGATIQANRKVRV